MMIIGRGDSMLMSMEGARHLQAEAIIENSFIAINIAYLVM
jgi:hypothetical protein